jgi:hypothetical protein
MGRADVAARLLRDSPASALKVEERQVLETRIRGIQASAIPDSASRRKQALFASLSTGLDGNIAGLPSRGGMDCAPIALDGLQLESGCGPALQLRAGGWYVPRPGLRVAYRLFHQDYFIQEQRAFRRSDHQLQVGYSPVRKLGVVSSLDVVYASGQVQTPYRLTGQVRGFMRGPSLSWVDTRGEAWYAVDRYSDLAELLPLTAEAACTSEESAAVGGLYCTAGFSGRRYGVGTGGRVGGNAWSARAGLQLERREAQDPLWSGLELRNGLEARLRVAPATYLEGTLLAGFSWFQGWEMQRVEPGVALGFRPDDGLQLRLTYNYSRQSAVPVDDTDSSLEPTLYRRQVIGLELWGIYR